MTQPPRETGIGQPADGISPSRDPLSRPVRILALETSGRAGSVATLEGGELLVERSLESDQRTAQTLIPAVQAVLAQTGWRAGEVELVAVTSGPGSFTGLRIGVMAAKTLAYATGAALVGVNTLSVIARQCQADVGLLWVILNAERNQLFAASFRREPAGWRMAESTRIVERDSWLAMVRSGGASGRSDRPGMAGPAVGVAGPGVGELLANIPPGVELLPAVDWAPRASAVGKEAWCAYREGYRSDCWTLSPHYFRESAAEEKARQPTP